MCSETKLSALQDDACTLENLPPSSTVKLQVPLLGPLNDPTIDVSFPLKPRCLCSTKLDADHTECRVLHVEAANNAT